MSEAALYSLMSLIASSALYVAVATHLYRHITQHVFFLFFAMSALIYLQLVPFLSLLGYADQIFDALSVAIPHRIAFEYAAIQAYCLVFFLIPLCVSYLYHGSRGRPARVEAISSVPRSRRALPFGIAMLVFSGIFLWVAYRNELLVYRQGNVITSKFVDMPMADFMIYRLFGESGLFLIAATAYLALVYRGTHRWLLILSAGVVAAFYGGFVILNSRLMTVLSIVVMLGVFAAVRWRSVTTPRHLVAAGLCAGLAFVALKIVMNFRLMGISDGLTLQHLNPFATGMVSDGQGVARLNGVDLVARMYPAIEERGPAFGEAWSGVKWLFWRFVDPAGFDEYRLAQDTTAKAFLMKQYLGWGPRDYFSCFITDLFGSFHILGLLGSGLGLGWVFARCEKAVLSPRSAERAIVALFFLVHLLLFEQEAIMMLIGWLKKLPVLLAVLALLPLSFREAEVQA